MSTLGKAIIVFGADTATFRSDVGRGVAIMERGVGQMQASLRRLDGPLTKLTAGFSLAAAGMFAKSVIDTADEVGKLSQKVGIGTETLSGWKLAAELGDVANEQFTKGLKEFNKTLVEATNESSKSGRVLKALGVDIRAGPELAFRQFADAVAALPEDLKLSTVSAIMGKAGGDWIPVLNAGSKGLDEMHGKARALGLIISEDFAKQAERFNDNLKLIQKSSIGTANVILSGGMLDAFAGIAENIAKATERGEKWKGVLDEIRKASLAAAATTFNVPFLPPVVNNVARAALDQAAQRAFADPMEAARLRAPSKGIGGLAPGETLATKVAGESRPDPEAVRRALADSEALAKRQASALEQMEGKKQSLLNLNEEELMLERVLTGSYKEFNAETKVKLLNIALEIDARKQLIDRVQADLEAGLVEQRAREAAGEMMREYYLANKQATEQLEFETDLIGRTIGEQERLNAVRQIDLELLERKRRIGVMYGEDVAGAMVAVADAEREAARAREAVNAGLDNRQQRERGEIIRQNVEAIRFETSTLGMNRREVEKLNAIRSLELQMYGRILTEQERSILLTEKDIALRRQLIGVIEERQRVERDWATGAKRALEDYADAATDMAAMTRDAFLNAFRGMEDALVNFVKTGKLNFRDLANSIIDDLIRIAIRRSITGPIAEGIGGALPGLGSLFGFGGGGSAAAGSAGAGDLTALAFSFAAKGGVMSSAGMLPLHAYSRGGIARSAQLAIYGEGSMNEAIVPLPDGKRIPVDLRGAGGGRAGDTYYIDASGADPAAIARLERALAQVDGSVEYRSLAATANAMGRGGAFRHRMRR